MLLRRIPILFASLLALLNLGAVLLHAQEPVYSGPQVGEPLPPFTVRGALGEDAGKEMDFIRLASGKPIALIFVHEVTRPALSMTRILSAYTQTRAKDGLFTGVVWLDQDATNAETTLKRVSHALTPKVPVGISIDGGEGPGSYGLNRKVMLTILVGNRGQVTANFALVQPSLQADLPKILTAIAQVVGGPVPELKDLPEFREMADNRASSGPDDKLRGLLRPVIQRSAQTADVDRAAAALEEYVAGNKTARAEVARIANTIISAGKLSDYGTPRAQEYLQKWAKSFAEGSDAPAASGAAPAKTSESPKPSEPGKPSESGKVP